MLLVLLGLQTQAQISPCDSVEYTITSTPNNTVLQLNGIINGVCPVNFPCTAYWSWSVCDDNLCFSDTGQVVYFQQFNASDTLKVCLTAVLNIDTLMTYTCMQCDSIVYGSNGWMLMMNNPTSINELTLNKINDGKIYDLLGRELTEIPLGTMYIRNQKLYITKWVL